MTKTIGRNELCPCGSGKKYKKCCLQTTAQNTQVSDLTYRKLRQTEGTLVDNHLMPYINQHLPKHVIEGALHDFIWEELAGEVDEKLLFTQLFIPWLLFNWIPDDELETETFDSNKTIAQNYLTNYQSQLRQEEMDFLDAMNKTYFSFYSILEVNKGASLVVKDCILGTTHHVTEKQGTQHTKRGQILFGRLLTLHERTLFVGFSPYAIPTAYQSDMIQFRKWLIGQNEHEPITPESLRDELECEVIDYYFEVLDVLFNPQLPKLQNKEGDEIQFTTSYFTLTVTPEDTFKRLLPITLSDASKDILSDAKRDSQGYITHLEFPWLKQGNKLHKGWENTVMGHIIIKKEKLILETNSANRNKQGKQLLENHLQDNIQFQNTLIETPEQKLKSRPQSTQTQTVSSDELLELAEVQEQLKAMATAHWDAWFDDKIPALENQTPREAAKTEEGRELLEALLLQYETHDSEHDNNLFRADINYLKKELGLQ